MSAIVMSVMITFIIVDDGNNNHYAQKEVIMIEKPIISDTIHDTIYIIVPDQNAYNIGYFDGNSDAYY